MKKRYKIKDTNGSYLVSGTINDTKFDGNGEPYLFTVHQAELLVSQFNFTKELVIVE
jgi:hypothetical protein